MSPQKAQKSDEQAVVALLDAHALIHRAYHALPPLTSPGGEMVNAVYGVASLLMKVIRELNPTHMAACFDLPGPTFRHEEFEAYKAHRPQAPEELARQIAIVRKLFEAFGIPPYEKPGFEADDLLGTIVAKLKTQSTKRKPKLKIKITIVTGDLDTLQLVDEEVSVYTLRRGIQDAAVYDQAAVKERYGLKPDQIVDLKALKGDPSDNIPGVPGIGEKTAAVLMRQFGTLEKLYEALPRQPERSGGSRGQSKSVLSLALSEKLSAHKDQAFLSKRLATIRKDAPISITLDDIAWSKGVSEKLVRFFTELGFKSLLSRFAGADATGVVPKKERQARHNAAQANLWEAPPSARSGAHDIRGELERLLQTGVFSKEIYALELALVPVIDVMQKTGVLIDSVILKALAKEIERDLQKIEQKIFKLAGEEFNVLSPPQLSKTLFEELGMPTAGLRKTPGGVVSTQASELAKIRELSPIIPLVEHYRELSKLKSTYVDALPLLVDASTGRLHTTFKQLGAETGRLASESPNLQNIPVRSELGRRIRRAFVAAPGYTLLSADYSQIELRVAAVLSEDETLIDAFRRGEDVHTATAAHVFGVSGKNVTPDMRRQAKVINFGILYGMGPQGLAEAADISRAEAKAFIDTYFRSFPGIAKYVQETKRRAHELGYVQSMFGRRRYVVGLDSRDARVRAAAERAAVNMPVQSTATADIIKMAMVALAKKFQLDSPALRLLLQVHDELLFEVKKDLVAPYAGPIKEIMEAVVKFPIPLVVDIKVGENWGEMRPLDKQIAI